MIWSGVVLSMRWYFLKALGLQTGTVELGAPFGMFWLEGVTLLTASTSVERHELVVGW